VLYDRSGGVGVGAELPAGSRTAAELVELSGIPVLAGREPALAVGVRDDAAVRLVLDRAITLAAGSGRARLTLVHKANAVKATDGMLYRVYQERAATSPIALDHVIVDALGAELLLRPTAYEALFVPPLYSTMVEGFLAALAGEPAVGLLAAGAQAVLAGHRRGAPDVLLGLCAAAARLLEVSGQRAAADRLDDAVAAAAGTPMPADPARVVADLLDHPR
jgi:isocitrate/isopropylmalate dehydrogenase